MNAKCDGISYIETCWSGSNHRRNSRHLLDDLLYREQNFLFFFVQHFCTHRWFLPISGKLESGVRCPPRCRICSIGRNTNADFRVAAGLSPTSCPPRNPAGPCDPVDVRDGDSAMPPSKGFVQSVRFSILVGSVLGVGLVALMAFLLNGEDAEQAREIASSQLGQGYQYHVTSLNISTFKGQSSVSGVVTAWNSSQIVQVPVHWSTN